MENKERDINRYEERKPMIPPRTVLMIISGLLLLVSACSLLKNRIVKNYQPFVINLEGQSRLRTKDMAEFTIPWKAEFELGDRELYHLYGEEFDKQFIDGINFYIRKYYFNNGIFDTLLFQDLLKDSKEIRNIPHVMKIDSAALCKYIPNPSLVYKRLILQKFGIIDPEYDYNIGLYMKPINLVFLQHDEPISYSAKLADLLQRKIMEEQKVIRAENDAKGAKEHLEIIKAEKEKELALQDAILHANKMRMDAELHVRRAMAAQAKRDAELINKTRKHILDSIDNN